MPRPGENGPARAGAGGFRVGERRVLQRDLPGEVHLVREHRLVGRGDGLLEAVAVLHAVLELGEAAVVDRAAALAVAMAWVSWSLPLAATAPAPDVGTRVGRRDDGTADHEAERHAHDQQGDGQTSGERVAPTAVGSRTAAGSSGAVTGGVVGQVDRIDPLVVIGHREAPPGRTWIGAV